MSFFIVVIAGLSIGNSGKAPSYDLNSRLNRIAESYVKLVLAVGQHDSLYVDAYYGPKEWLTEASTEQKPIAVIRTSALLLSAELDSVNVDGEEEILKLRHQYLKKQISSLIARVEVLGGKKLTFDEEAKA